MDDAKGKVESPTIGISLNAQFAAGRTVVFQTFVPQDINAEGLKIILQKLNSVADCEEAFYAQDQARKQLEVEENAAANIARRLEEVEGNMKLAMAGTNKRNPEPSKNDMMAKKQALDSVEESNKRIAACKKYLADLVKRRQAIGMALQAQQIVSLADALTKTCNGCCTVKLLTEFHRRSDAPKARYRARCKTCMYEANRKLPNLRVLQEGWKKRNREIVNKQARERRAKSPSKHANASTKWRLKNLAYCAERTRRRDAAKRGATPAWANQEAIGAFYIEARRLTALTGIQHEVDHIYPLVSDVMCGLHVEFNLQILTKSANSAKKNRVA